MSSASKDSNREKKDLEKFTKFLALKSAQIIVQSRFGEKIRTNCNPLSSGTDWFNLAIIDVPEVLVEAKSAVSNGASGEPLCVEISLRTIEGDCMVLETWSVGLETPQEPLPSSPTPARLTYTVYNRMGILLKSLVSVTRVTPAYKLSRRQASDSYTICYRIYVGQPILTSLGEEYKKVRVGQVSTPMGSVSVRCAYRTKMTISPQHSKETIMLKSDHFRPEMTPNARQISDETNTSLSETIRIGAFAESRKAVQPDLVMPEVPFSRLLRQAQAIQPIQKEQPIIEPILPNKLDNENGNTQPNHPQHNDDFIMLDLKTPFAGCNGNSELGVFYRECQSAPPLQGTESSTLDQLGDLTRQLEAFETSFRQYDSVIARVCSQDNNN